MCRQMAAHLFFICPSSALPVAQHLLHEGEGLKPFPYRETISGKFILTSKYRDLSRYFTESFTRFFSKNRGCGQSPRSLILFIVEFLMLLVYNKQNKNRAF